jgi:hypothetical protein
MSPVSLTMTLAQKPKKIPATTQSCQNMTSAPRTRCGACGDEESATLSYPPTVHSALPFRLSKLGQLRFSLQFQCLGNVQSL